MQKLSDSFKVEQENPAPLELKVEVYNINYGKSSELIRRSESLNNYSFFVQKVRDYEAAESQKDEHTLERAIEKAMRYCIEHDIMADFLETHGSEVSNLLLEEWDMDEALKDAKEEGRIEGREEGKEEERKSNILALKGVLAPEVIAEKFNLTVEYVLDVLKKENNAVI